MGVDPRMMAHFLRLFFVARMTFLAVSGLQGEARKLCLLVATAFEVSKSEHKDNPFESMSPRSCGGVPYELEGKLLNRKNLTALKVLGSGQFGQVYLADQALDGDDTGHVKQRAVKVGS